MKNQINYSTKRTNEEVIETYLQYRFLKLSIKGNEFLVRCPFTMHQHDDTRPAMNVNRFNGQYKCFKCGQKGNLITLAKHFGDDLNKLFN